MTHLLLVHFLISGALMSFPLLISRYPLNWTFKFLIPFQMFSGKNSHFNISEHKTQINPHKALTREPQKTIFG